MQVIAGLARNAVHDFLEFGLGQRGSPDGRAEYAYLRAASPIEAGHTVVVHADGSANEITAESASPVVGINGGPARVAIAPEQPDQPITEGRFFWGLVASPTVAARLELAGYLALYPAVFNATLRSELREHFAVETSDLTALIQQFAEAEGDGWDATEEWYAMTSAAYAAAGL
jgi:hypothetical protein